MTVYQTDQDHGTVFLAMELLEGETLDARIRREAPLPVGDLLGIAEQIATGLAAIHESEMIHRDIKPSNIWLLPGRNAANSEETEKVGAVGAAHSAVKILDFGLVRDVHEDSKLTEAGIVVGTPAYMSPEQARGLPLDHRTDLFSFGCVLYAMATGRAPFDASTPLAQAAALAADEPVDPRKLNRDLPKALSCLIAELLDKDPDRRPPSANHVIERLRQMSDGDESDAEPSSVPRPGSWGRYLVAFTLLTWLGVAALLAVVIWYHPEKPNDTSADLSSESAVVYLQELRKVDEVKFPPPGLPPPPGVDGTVRVGGIRSPHGIFMHGQPPFQRPSSVSYELDKKYSLFTAEVAMNDSAGKWRVLQFVVLADGKEVWRSRKFSAGDEAERCQTRCAGRRNPDT